jgi:hypothetical protein
MCGSMRTAWSTSQAADASQSMPSVRLPGPKRWPRAWRATNAERAPLGPGRPRPPGAPPPLHRAGDDVIDALDAAQQRRERRFDDPLDVRLGKRVPDVVHDRRRLHDLGERRRELDDQDAHAAAGSWLSGRPRRSARRA